MFLGGRKGAAVLCELVPGAVTERTATTAYDPYSDPRYQEQLRQQQQQYPSYPESQRPSTNYQYQDPYQQTTYPNDGGYPNYPSQG